MDIDIGIDETGRNTQGVSSMRIHLTRSGSHRIAAAAMAVAAITGISACSSSAPANSSASPAAGQSISPGTNQNMAASDFATALKAPGTIVLDVRTPAEYASGHLPNAQNIDIEGPDFATQIAALDKKATYAVYCRTGNRSAAALEKMAAIDITRAYHLIGGIGAWQSIDGPVVMGGP